MLLVMNLNFCSCFCLPSTGIRDNAPHHDLVYMVLRLKPRASWILGKHITNWATVSGTITVYFFNWLIVKTFIYSWRWNHSGTKINSKDIWFHISYIKSISDLRNYPVTRCGLTQRSVLQFCKEGLKGKVEQRAQWTLCILWITYCIFKISRRGKNHSTFFVLNDQFPVKHFDNLMVQWNSFKFSNHCLSSLLQSTLLAKLEGRWDTKL